jgi:LPS O-antigen subunit length determinant protein (WzzB/FepE family)
MKKKILQDDMIDLQDVLKILWKEKILIIFFCIIGLIFSKTYYETKYPETYEEYETNIVLQEAPEEIFMKYSNVVNFDLNQELNQKFKLLLLSNDIKVKFLEQNDFKGFKNFLKENDINAKQYFESKKFGKIDQNSKNYRNDNNYYFRFPKILNGQEFLNEFVLFVRDESITNIKKKVDILLDAKIEQYKIDLKIANEVNFKHPEYTNILVVNGQVERESTDLFYKGTIVLQNRIADMISLKKELNDNLFFSFNPILDGPSSSINMPRKSYLISYYLFGLTLAFILSLITIMIKNIKKKIK